MPAYKTLKGGRLFYLCFVFEPCRAANVACWEFNNNHSTAKKQPVRLCGLRFGNSPRNFSFGKIQFHNHCIVNHYLPERNQAELFL